jgi:hypothetical protein
MGLCSSRCDRDAPDAAHLRGTPCAHPASGRGWQAGGRDAEAARGRALLAAIATRRMRHTRVACPAHIPPPAVAGGRGFARRELHGDVLGSLRSRRPGCSTHTGGTPGAHLASDSGRRAGGREVQAARGRARLAAIATRRMRHTHTPCAHPAAGLDTLAGTCSACCDCKTQEETPCYDCKTQEETPGALFAANHGRQAGAAELRELHVHVLI